MAEVTMGDAGKVYDEDIVSVWDTSLDIKYWASYRRSRRSIAMAAANAAAPSRSGSLNTVFFYVFLAAFALPLTVVIPRFAAVYTVDYGARAAAAVITIPLVVLVLIFEHRVASGLTAGAVKR